MEKLGTFILGAIAIAFTVAIFAFFNWGIVADFIGLFN